MRLALRGWLVALLLFGGRPACAADDPATQKELTSAARDENRNASNNARRLGDGSILRGLRNIRMGRAAHHPPEVRLGTVQVIEGILGLLAGLKAGKMADQDGGNEGRLGAANLRSNGASAGAGDSLPGSGTPGITSAAGSSRVAGAGGGLALSSSDAAEALLKDADPDLRKALTALEQDYGFERRKLVGELASGAGTREVLAKAPLSAFTADELDEAFKAAKKEQGKDEPKLLASPARPSPSAAGPAATADESVSLAGGRDHKLRDSLTKSLGEEEEELEMSPEVKAALAARAAQEQAERERLAHGAADELDLFSVVHLKYRERENHLRWGAPLRATGYGL